MKVPTQATSVKVRQHFKAQHIVYVSQFYPLTMLAPLHYSARKFHVLRSSPPHPCMCHTQCCAEGRMTVLFLAGVCDNQR